MAVGITVDPEEFMAGANLHGNLAKARLQTFSQLLRIEDIFSHTEYGLDEFLAKEPLNSAWSGSDVGANAPTKLGKLLRREIGTAAANGVVVLKVATDGLLEKMQEGGRVCARPQRRQQAAGIVVAAVDARLIVIGGAGQQMRFTLDQHYPSGLRKPERDEATIDAAANDDDVVVHSLAPAPILQASRRGGGGSRPRHGA